MPQRRLVAVERDALREWPWRWLRRRVTLGPMQAEEFLLAFHRAHPGVTTRAFARGRGADGRSSYQVLAAVPDEHASVVDLGCGDGYLLELLRGRGFRPSQLTGVDMSPDELALARRRPALAGVELICEQAQHLSLADSSVDCILSHLAFMLMNDMERVVEELGRVLVPGGRFATVVGGGPKLGDAFELFLDLFRTYAEREGLQVPRMGDRRARSEEGVAELFSRGRGFQATDIVDIPVAVDGTADEVWGFVSTIYDMFEMRPEARAELERAFRAEATRLAHADGTIPCSVALRLVTCER